MTLLLINPPEAVCALKFIALFGSYCATPFLFLCGSAFKICRDIYQLLMTYFDVFRDHLSKILQNNLALQLRGGAALSPTQALASIHGAQ